ncbi:hypothetical protein GLOIN_2v1544505 [Rhizophagus irregularis DAOM 181602=DAOM 197198]|uniref:Uncharacterized protein n=1 Tax=Rhizophagus irregularis (strain DAOM 181602 / DAOM 197198 / MUCL 43194) TaxID=747089 RepID=A0A2P4QJQ8_RHIID|nr:hypothetical protein GLOIN_2v1544505 [Rhizophagus irregularis DAOM 181602=DAOM 197198]POG77887.1 hypothetical protein GLOIN_2v1544505 [Rhizophagus irregularis DAOM 181602=DAOM 197198]GET55504.1 hypothetical protein GLOIN_2v1544505 [Rhizophagus irregularis DAOM 181602=DAOM 197198]|eukprot:XP_025184753.1 hypothetical protein GLOIN_2v1544505 [Rhizophagus irregularis DAOM 181602=DAOM 197198]
MSFSNRSYQFQLYKERRLRRKIINHYRRFASNNNMLRRISNLPQQNSTNSFVNQLFNGSPF